MATTMRLLPVRTTAALRAVIDQAGPVNAATRALIIIGAHAAGLSLTGLEREIALLFGEELEPSVGAALHHVYLQLTISAPEEEAQRLLDVERPSEVTETLHADLTSTDLFGTIGIEV